MERYLKPERFEADPLAGQNHQQQWLHWKKTFQNFLEVSKVTEDEYKHRLLINFVSPNIYEYIANANSYESAILALEALFVKPKSEIFARHKLASRKQQPEETIDQYLESLKLLSKECSFKAVTGDEYERDFIRDSFIAGLASPVIRQRLLEHMTLTLDEAHTKARSLESAQIQAQSFDPHQFAAALQPAPVTAAAHPHRKTTNFAKPHNDEKCYFCGNQRHPTRRLCPAVESNCLKCGKKGHFAKVCRGTSSNNAAIMTFDRTDEISSCLMLAASGVKLCTRPVTINGISVKALIDTGSTASFIDEEIIKQYDLPTKPWRQDVTMASSSHTSQITQVCPATLTLDKQIIPEIQFRVMKSLCCNVILGHDVLEQYSKLEVEFGGHMPPLKLFALEEAHIDPVDLFTNMALECKPIAVKSRRYALEDQKFIKNEVMKLLADGIIEESTSPWRAQVLVTSGTHHKKRMCIDYSQTVNRYTYLDAYPLPNIEELVAKISNYKIFSKIDLKSAYHQIPIINGNKPMTAFEAVGNLYQFRRIPFGVTNGVPARHRLDHSKIWNRRNIYIFR